MYHLILSDLHLGAGDEREDFLRWKSGLDAPGPDERPAAIRTQQEAFVRLLEAHRSAARGAGLQPHLLLLGDVLDLWQVQRPRESVGRATVRILAAHAPVVQALAAWNADGGEVTWLLGNHDQPLVEAGGWTLLRERLPALNRLRGGTPLHWFRDEAAGLYAEHGHQWDPFHRVRGLHRPHADCAGRRIVRSVVNPLKAMVPLIDKGASVADLLLVLLRALEGVSPVLWRESLARVRKLLGGVRSGAGDVLRVLDRILEGRDWEPLDPSAVLADLGLVPSPDRFAADPAAAATGLLPAHLRFVASGHTHQAALRHHEGITLLNPGTWRPVLTHAADGTPELRQRLTYGVLFPLEGSWTMRLEELDPADAG